MKRKIMAGVCSAVLAASCFGVTALAATESTDKLTSYEATSENVKLIGRTYRKGDSTLLGYSASGIEFKCTGTKAVFNLNGQAGPVRIGVFVNGKLVKQGYIKNKKTNAVEVDLEEGENTVKLIKLSEGAQSVLGVESFEVDGTPQPTSAAAHSIEFIGDSITCGYGVDAPLGKSFSIYNENAAKTYAYKTAKNFGADYSFVSVSGTGIISSYSGNGKKNEAMLLPDFYDKFCFTWSWIDGEEVAQYDWNFSDYQPELIVVNLGTNDNSYTRGDEAKCAEYEQGYVDFLKHIREKNPDAEILCTLGLMGQELYPNIENAVDTYIDETGDNKIKTFELSVQDNTANGYAVDYHPAPASHATAAEELTSAISDLYGWEATTPEDDGVDAKTMDDDVEFSNIVEVPSSEPSNSEVSSNEVSSNEEISSVSANSTATTSSAASSKASSNASKTNPSTNAAMGVILGLSALAGAAVVCTKRK